METVGDILVLPFFGQGHLNPCVELCKHLSSYNKSKVILIVPSHLSSSIPSTLRQEYPSVEVLEIEASYTPLPPPPSSQEPQDLPESEGAKPGPKPAQLHGHEQMGQGIESFISERYKNVPGQTRPGCVVVDLMMSWSNEIFLREDIPIVSFFTSGACSTAMEYAAWKAQAHDMKPGETRLLDGLPECVALSYSDLKRRDHRRPHGHGASKVGDHRRPHDHGASKVGDHRRSHGDGVCKVGHRGPGGQRKGPDFGLRDPGQPPRWLEEGDDSTALLINTCHDLEGPFLDYIAKQVKRPVFSVGPLLPDKYWKSIGSVVHDRDSRPNRESNYTEDEIIQWLDSKPSQSVIYISFGSEVGPKLDEYAQLADALGDSNWSFIWVIQPGSGKPGGVSNLFGDKPSSNDKEEGFYPHGLEEKVGNRGLIIKGWAPQLMILSHPSTGGFLSHCGWNSTVEAIGRGIPILAWPIRGDQFYDAKLVVNYLKIGLMVSSGDDDLSEMVSKGDIMKGIDGLMGNREVHERATTLRGIFKAGYPSSSIASIKALIELIRGN